MGRVEWIHTAPSYGAEVVSRDRVEGYPGRGLDGDRYATAPPDEPSPSRRLRGDLTLIEGEEVDRLEETIGGPVLPGELRRNVTTRGIRLNALVGKRFKIGAVVGEGIELCEPCAYMQKLVGKPVLKPLLHRAGLRAAIIEGGDIQVGDTIEQL